MYQITVRGKVERFMDSPDGESPVSVEVLVRHYVGGETATNTVRVLAPAAMAKYLGKYAKVDEYRSFTGRYSGFAFGEDGRTILILEYLDMTF